MINKAIEKITKEAMELNAPFGFFIEEYLTSRCTTATVAAKLLDEKKSLKAFVEKITKEARAEASKNRVGNAGIAGKPDAEFFAMADEYWELGPAAPERSSGSAERVNVLDMF